MTEVTGLWNTGGGPVVTALDEEKEKESKSAEAEREKVESETPIGKVEVRGFEKASWT